MEKTTYVVHIYFGDYESLYPCMGLETAEKLAEKINSEFEHDVAFVHSYGTVDLNTVDEAAREVITEAKNRWFLESPSA